MLFLSVTLIHLEMVCIVIQQERTAGNLVYDGVEAVYLNAHGKNRKDIPEELLMHSLRLPQQTRRKESVFYFSYF